MSGFLIAVDGSVTAADVQAAKRLLDEGTLAWFDLFQPGDGDLSALQDAFGIHPLAVEDAAHFGQRPKLEEYDDFAHLVAFGAQAMGEPLVEVHCFYSERFLVTVRREECAAVTGLAERVGRRGKPLSRLLLLHHLLDGLVDSFFPALAAFDDRIDDLHDAIFVKPTDEQLSELFTMKRWLIGARKLVAPQRDLVASLVSGVTELPGMTREIERYFRDLYDHLIRINDLVDSYRDLLSGAMDAYLSTVSNRLNTVMKQLTVIATVFLPLTFLTGFFGQNFQWLIQRMSSLPEFLGIGIGIEVIAVAGLVVVFRRRGWM